MRDFKLISILRTFSKEEMKNFGLFISSPYFNRKRNYDRIYRLLKKYHPEFPPDKLTSEKIFTYLYPGEIFNKSKSTINIRVLFSQLTNLAEKFMAYESFEQDRYDYIFNERIANEYSKKRLFKLAYRKQLMNSAELDAGEKTDDYYHRRMNTDLSLGFLNITLYKARDQYKYIKNNLLYLYADMISNLAGYLSATSVWWYRRNVPVKGIELAKSFADAFDPELFEREFEDDAFNTKNKTIFYYYIIKTFLDETDTESPLKALEYFYKFFPYVPHLTQHECFVYLQNRLIYKRFDRFYGVKLNELYDFVLEKGAFSPNKNSYLKHTGYMNILYQKLYLSDTPGIRKFIDTYSEKVTPKFREDIRNFSLALLSFREKRFGKCLEYSSKKDNLEILYKVDKHQLTMCSLFEEGLFEEAIYAADSFEHFLRRNKNKIEPKSFKNHFEFLRGSRYLLRLENDEVSVPDKSLTRILETQTHTVFYDWLNEKLMKHQIFKSKKTA